MEEMKKMDPKMVTAAESGDLSFLIATIDACRSDDDCSCLLSRRTHAPDNKGVGNILHLAAWNGREEFFREAIHLIPNQIVQTLFSHQEPSGKKPHFNPLHVAANVGHLGIIKLINGFYTNSLGASSNDISKPWLAKDAKGSTPLHVALKEKEEECALAIMSMDLELFCNMIDESGNSPLFLAVRNGLSRVALQILKSGYSYRVSGEGGLTPLHVVPKCSEEVLELLLKTHQNPIEAIDYKVIRKWTETNKLWPLEYLLKTIAPESKRHLIDLFYDTNNRGDNVFHAAARGRKLFNAAKFLANVYREERAKEAGLTSSLRHRRLPWLVTNKRDQTPLGLAMSKNNNNKEAYDEYCELQKAVDMEPVIHGKIELLFLAIEKKLYHAAMGIWDIKHKYGWSLYPSQGWEIWHAALKFSEGVAKWVDERLSDLTLDPIEVKKTLREASETGLEWVVKLMMEKDPYALESAPLAWLEACKRGHLSTIFAFIDNCTYFRELCRHQHTSPLHHIRLESYEQYKMFLDHPVIGELSNFQDIYGATPLHQAIKNRDILFTELLLKTNSINRNLKDDAGKTAMDLLVQVCHQDRQWDDMCKRNEIILGKYFQDKSGLLEFRNSLSVVAALLAAITFTAGFTLPGGVKSDSTGEATLANKAVFLVFLLTDVFAMCCSMLVLICLLWSISCDRDTSVLLVEGSMRVLMLALNSTLVAFMTGVYAVISHKSLWVGIVILVMCSVLIISSTRSVTIKLLSTIKTYKDEILSKINTIKNKYKDENFEDDIQLLEQGEASTSTTMYLSRRWQLSAA